MRYSDIIIEHGDIKDHVVGKDSKKRGITVASLYKLEEVIWEDLKSFPFRYYIQIFTMFSACEASSLGLRNSRIWHSNMMYYTSCVIGLRSSVYFILSWLRFLF